MTQRGKLVAAVVPVRSGVDAMTFTLSHHPDFIEGINRSWLSCQEKGGISLEDVEREFGIKPKAARRLKRKARSSR